MTRPVRIGVALGLVFAVAVGLGWAATTWLGPLIPTRAPDPATRPTPHPFAPFTLELSVAGGPVKQVAVATDGDCSALQPSQRLFDICSLAVNADAAVIGGAAFGRLNSEDTPSFDALVWRARANRDAGICAAGGLLDSRLTECQREAADPAYELVDAGEEVRIPLAP